MFLFLSLFSSNKALVLSINIEHWWKNCVFLLFSSATYDKRALLPPLPIHPTPIHIHSFIHRALCPEAATWNFPTSWWELVQSTLYSTHLVYYCIFNRVPPLFMPTPHPLPFFTISCMFVYIYNSRWQKFIFLSFVHSASLVVWWGFDSWNWPLSESFIEWSRQRKIMWRYWERDNRWKDKNRSLWTWAHLALYKKKIPSILNDLSCLVVM